MEQARRSTVWLAVLLIVWHGRRTSRWTPGAFPPWCRWSTTKYSTSQYQRCATDSYSSTTSLTSSVRPSRCLIWNIQWRKRRRVVVEWWVWICSEVFSYLLPRLVLLFWLMVCSHFPTPETDKVKDEKWVVPNCVEVFILLKDKHNHRIPLVSALFYQSLCLYRRRAMWKHHYAEGLHLKMYTLLSLPHVVKSRNN